MNALVLRYVLFALLATLVNIALQALSLGFYGGEHSLYLAMFWGTLGGLVVKYVLDKRYIFYHKVTRKREHASLFSLYASMGVVTTMLFWGIEILFDALIKELWAKYLGAVVGLGLGYVLKYYLDKKFVFRSRNAH